MKKIFIILVLPFILYAQEGTETNPAVELPDFIITGKDIINLQQTKKPEAEPIPVTSEDFLKPMLNPEELELGDIHGPESFNMNLRDSVFYRTGSIKTLFGVYTLPNAAIRISSPYEGGLFEGHLDGENTRPYVKNAERYFLNAGVGLSLFSGYESTFLPGTEYKIMTDFTSRAHKFYAGIEPALKRNLYQGSFGVSAINLYSKNFLIDLNSGYKYTTLKDEEFSEGLFHFDGFSRINFGKFNGGINLNYNNQMFSDSNTAKAYYNFISLRPYAGFELSKVIKASFGISYSHAKSSSITAPYASIHLKISKNLTFFGEYSPGGEFYTSSEFLNRNIYFNSQNRSNIFIKKTNNLQTTLKFEYDRYFEINGGFRFRTYNNLPYFSDMSPDGKFTVNTADAEQYGLFINMLFHRGPFGYFYASAEAGEVTDEKNNFIPYFPSLISSLTYGYDFPIGLNAESNLIYRSAVYADAANTNKINAYINLKISLSYNVSENLKLIAGLNNLLNRDNFIWSNYKEIPMDLSAGISYIW